MFYNKSIRETEEELGTSSESGLSEKEALRRQQNGKNKLPQPPPKTKFDIFLEQLKSPIVFILIAATIFSLIIKSFTDAIFIFAVILLNTLFGTYQEWHSEKSAEKLQNMIKIKVKVLRDGNVLEIDSEDIVVGDVVLIESGDKIAADLRLVETNNLSIDESILTGESVAKEKDTEVNDLEVKVADRSNIAYCGTVVTKGRGKGIVVAIAEKTEFGKIADKVIFTEDTKSPLIIRMEKFVKQLSIGFLFLAAILCIIMYFKNYSLIEIFQNVVGLTVSAIPEGLTIAMTIALSIASSEMAKRNVIVKKLNSVESLGSCTVIATDKTGTLTVNEQTAKKVLLPTGTSAYIKGTGYNDKGDVDFDDNTSEIEIENIKELSKLGMLNNEATLNLKENTFQGDAIDIAFLALGYKMQIQLTEEIIKTIPYESSLKYSAVYYKKNDNKNVYCTVKGATEKVLEFCKKMKTGNTNKKIDKQLILNQMNDLAKQGFRVIAVANGVSRHFGLKEKLNVNKMENDLTFLGLVAFVDPVREDVIDAVRKCNLAGIKVAMITGDHPLTANAIGERIGIKEIYARVSPMEKLEIVEKYKNDGEFVAVTGDGVNDTPALKSANIGVAMGSGTDIAKETGNMIIADDNFASIVNGIELGRKAYNNIRKVIYLLLSTGFAEIILYTLSIICGYPLPLTGIQLLWLNFISNGIQDCALAMEKDAEDVMRKKVKNAKESIINKLLISEIGISSILIGVISFVFYTFLIKVQNMDITMARTYMLTLLVVLENFHIFNCRSETISCFKIPFSNNRVLITSVFATTVIQFAITQIPFIANILGLTIIPLKSALCLIAFTIPVFIVMEIFKAILRKKENKKKATF